MTQTYRAETASGGVLFESEDYAVVCEVAAEASWQLHATVDVRDDEGRLVKLYSLWKEAK